MMFRTIPAGATIVRTYLTVTSAYGPGEEFPNTPDGWNAAVETVQAKKAALVESITDSLGAFATADSAEHTANVQCRIDLRWTLRWDVDPRQGGASGIDTVVESYKDVDRLRTFHAAGASSG